jgi:sulfatase maturation enzyme AslB (radical SAM superfamily)
MRLIILYTNISMKKENNTYCRVPFDSVTVSPTGRMQLCCEAQWTGGTEKTKLKDVASINDWFKGDYLNSVRKKMLNGERLSECETCYKNERTRGMSSRLVRNAKYFEHNDDVLEQSIKKVDLKLGNKCNLKCKMCFPYASSELWKEWNALGWNTKEKDPNSDTSWKYYDGYFKEDYSWPKAKSNMDKIKKASEGTKVLHVTGGEPTINPEFFDLLNHLIETGNSKNIILEVTTNATKIHPRFFRTVEKFKELRLTISMDGVDKTYEYVRYPAKFDIVYENIKKYSAFVKTLGGDSKLVFNFVMQMWNLHNAVDVVKRLTPWAVNEPEAPVRFEELHDPRFMHWSILPQENIKRVIRQTVEEQRKDNDRLTNWGLIALARMLRTIQSHKDKDKEYLLQQLKKFTNTQDTHRGIDLADYIPDLVDFIR